MRDYEELLETNVGAVDIGANGGIAFSCDGNMYLSAMDTESCQTEFDIFNLLPDKVYAENVRSFNAYGGALMQKKGRIEGFATATERELILIEPTAWMECFTMKGRKNFKSDSKWKNHLKEIAEKYTGREDITLKTADAVLIWIYAAH
jgi:hypothetical protein